MRILMPLVVFVAILAFPSPAFACSCVLMSDREATRAADVVFTGTVIAIDDPDGGGPIVSSGRLVRTTVKVDGVVKGDLGSDTVVVHAAADGASCGIDFALNRRYRVFGTGGDGGTVNTHLCSGTTQILANAGGVVKTSGSPVEPSAPAPPGESTPVPLIATITLAVLVIVATGAIGLMRSRAPRTPAASSPR